MGYLNRPYSGKRAPYDNYIDLESWQDDITVLKNPHKGWYWHYIDNGYGRDNYRKHVAPGDYMEDFPGLNHLYLRFDWGDIEKEEGVLDWSYIDSIMDEWGAKGYRFAFRICTYEGSGENDALRYATPKWVYEAGAKGIELSGGRLEPVYSDPIYLEKLENFMRAYGAKFNNDPRVEFIDIGSFGTWGEGHTGNGTETIYPNEVLKKHMMLHKKYFPDKHVLMNDDHVGHRGSESEESKQELVEFAKTLGCGARDDSVCVITYTKAFGFDTLRSPCFYDQLWQSAPVDIEFEHYSNVLINPDCWKEGLPFLDALKRTHATYTGFHGYPRPWLARFPWLTAYVANRVGYWYFIDGLRLTDWAEGCDSCMNIRILNRGFAPAYNRFALKIRAVNIATGEETVFDTDTDNRLWMPEELADVELKLATRSLPAGEYRLYAGLFEGDAPIRIAMSEERRDGDWYYLADTAVRPV